MGARRNNRQSTMFAEWCTKIALYRGEKDILRLVFDEDFVEKFIKEWEI